MEPLREQLVAQIKGRRAYASFEEIVGGFKVDQVGIVPHGIERSAWQVVEHMRLSLRDILEYSQNESGSYEEKEWPDGYWPKTSAPPAPNAWQSSIDDFLKDRAELEDLAKHGDLNRPLPWAPEHSLLQEIFVACDHIAYHCGELVLIGEMLGH